MDEVPEKSRLVQMAEHYYAVAKNLKGSARHQLDMAECLEQIADSMCEQSIREDNMT